MTDESTQKKRVIGRPWPKGVSGNPGGRAVILREIREAFWDGVPEAIERIRELMKDKNPRVALEASQYWCDRVMGKATERHALSTSPDGVEPPTILIRDLRGRAEGGGREPPARSGP